MTVSPFGLYLHVPFCDGKCPYCDFYSRPADEEMMDAYAAAVKRTLLSYRSHTDRPVSSLYLGGGTPSLLGSRRLSDLLLWIRRIFPVLPGAEITLEANPTRDLSEVLAGAAEGGVNRVSIGLQSANDRELRFLGRKHSAWDVSRAAGQVRRAGIAALSLDLMLALPQQREEDIARSVSFCRENGADHVSAYLLKVEEGTPFGQKREQLQLPDDDRAADLYLFTCRSLEENGYRQYEISNFSRPGREGRHNLCYWHDEEYLGIGPGAHSFFEGRRFYYPRDLTAFLRGEDPVSDGEGGSLPEYVMLGLRLTEGLKRETMAARFGPDGARAFDALQEKARRYRPTGLLQPDEHRIALTPAGFLVSNELISELSLALG